MSRVDGVLADTTVRQEGAVTTQTVIPQEAILTAADLPALVFPAVDLPALVFPAVDHPAVAEASQAVAVITAVAAIPAVAEVIQVDADKDAATHPCYG